MNTNQIANTQNGLIASGAFLGSFVLTGFSSYQANLVLRLIIVSKGFFSAITSLHFTFLAHILITGILLSISVKVGKFAYQSFKAAFNDTPSKDVVDRYWNAI